MKSENRTDPNRDKGEEERKIRKELDRLTAQLYRKMVQFNKKYRCIYNISQAETEYFGDKFIRVDFMLPTA